jgi:hypothetical protein
MKLTNDLAMTNTEKRGIYFKSYDVTTNGALVLVISLHLTYQVDIPLTKVFVRIMYYKICCG